MGIFVEDLMGTCLVWKRSPRKLGDIQGSVPSGQETMHLDEQNNGERGHETCLDYQENPVIIQEEARNATDMEAMQKVAQFVMPIIKTPSDRT
ncbi:hypothetical protein TURU_015530 [Turdus rufiventris]|nr:hypothetical protein TURU_015530 [Turdus rufiventris]